MNKNTETIQIRIDQKTKRAAKKFFSKKGITVSSGIKTLLRNALNTKQAYGGIESPVILYQVSGDELTPELIKKAQDAKRLFKKDPSKFVNL